MRLNLIDLALLAGAGAVSWLAHDAFTAHGLFWIPLYVAGTFFLFCNVFRIGNRLEPVWYLTFATVSAWGLLHPEYYWLAVLAICEPLKLALVIYVIRHGDYHGLGYRWVRQLMR